MCQNDWSFPVEGMQLAGLLKTRYPKASGDKGAETKDPENRYKRIESHSGWWLNQPV